jgi:hypothetical protein
VVNGVDAFHAGVLAKFIPFLNLALGEDLEESGNLGNSFFLFYK